jgi:RimJ/RimL family protein N-acetyltransferase
MKTENAEKKSIKIQNVAFDSDTTQFFSEKIATDVEFEHAAQTGFSVLKSPGDSVENCATGGGFVWKDKDVIIGCTQHAIHLPESIAKISIFILPEFRKAGLATQCAEQLVEYLFKETQVLTIQASFLPWNQAALRLLLNLGFKEVGLKKHQFLAYAKSSDHAELPWAMPSVEVELTRDQWSSTKLKSFSAEKSFGTDEISVANLEIDRLKVQVHLGHKEDIKFISSYVEKNKTQTIVDIGCGPGHYLKSLSESLPHLQCLGVDVNSIFIEYAKQEYSSEKRNFLKVDLLSQESPWPEADLYILRFMFQHFSEQNRLTLLKRFREEAPPHSALYIVDIDDRASVTEPSCPSFHVAMKFRDDFQSAHGGDRMIGYKIPALAAKTGLNVAAFQMNIFNSLTVPKNELFNTVDGFVFRQRADFKIVDERTLSALRKDFKDWYHNRMTYFGGALCASLVTK